MNFGNRIKPTPQSARQHRGCGVTAAHRSFKPNSEGSNPSDPTAIRQIAIH